MVRKAAKKAAKTAAKTSHSVYVRALRSSKVPLNSARDAARIRKHELSTKVELKKQQVAQVKKMQGIEIARKKKAHRHSEVTLKKATKRTLAVATADAKKKLQRKDSRMQ